MTEWPDMLARPLGSSAEVCQALAESLGGVEWRSGDGKPIGGEATDATYGGRYSICLHEDDAGSVCLIAVSNHASPMTLSVVMERFALNYCCTDFGAFRFPQLFDEHWNLL